MSTYSPDRWVIVKFNGESSKVLAGWSGGYLDGDNWRLSSGLEKIEEDGDYYNMINHSGSVYRCHKDSNEMNVIMIQMYDVMKQLTEKDGGTIEIISVEEFNDV